MLALRSLSPTTMSLTAGRARRTAGLLAALGALVAVPAAAEGAGTPTRATANHGPGDDTLDGGGNFDQLTGGPGVDTLNGGSGTT